MAADNPAIFAASRLRSTGADRSLAVATLMRSGITGHEADRMVDELDFDMGKGGRTLPDDATPLVARRLAEHRAEVAAHGEGSTLTATRPAPATQRSKPVERRVSTLASAMAQSAPGPRFSPAPPSSEETESQITASEPMPARDRHRMLAEAMKRSSQNVSRERIIRSLTDGGFREAEANESLDTIEKQLAGKRQTFERSRKRAIGFAYLQIVVSALFAIAGLAVGRITSLIIFGVMIAQGVQRLDAAKRQTFSSYVLTNR